MIHHIIFFFKILGSISRLELPDTPKRYHNTSFQEIGARSQEVSRGSKGLLIFEFKVTFCS